MRDVLLGEVWKVPTAQERIQNKLLSMQFQDEMDRRNELIKQANMLSGPPVMEQPMATPPEGQMLTHEQQHMQPQMPINTPSTMPIAQDAPQSTFPPQPMQNPMQNRNALAPQPQIQNYGQLQAQQQMQAMLGDQLKIVKALAESNPGAVEAYWNSNPMLKKLGSYNSEMAENGTVQHYISGPDGKPQMVGASFKVPGGKWQFVNLKDMNGLNGELGLISKSLKGDTDAKAILDERDRRNLKNKEQARMVIVNNPVKTGGGDSADAAFKNWTPTEKQIAFERFQLDGRPPFGLRDRDNNRLFQREYNAWLNSHGKTGREGVAERQDFTALSRSLANQERQIGMMGSFVRNLNKQTERLNTILADIKRVEPRALNVPYRKWMTSFRGSASEAILGMYAEEISNEIAKLASGSSASVAQLNEGARVTWSKIHDPNLSLTEMPKLFKETSYAANMRMASAREEAQYTRELLRKGRSNESATNSVGPKSTTKGKIDRAMAKEELKKRGKVINDKNIALAIEILEGGQ